jgi:heptose I phosphotransferase
LLGLLLGWLVRRWPRARPGGFTTASSARRDWLRGLGLTEAEHFLALNSLIVSGHPGRQVGRLVLGDGDERRPVYLKREQGVRWTTRLANFLSGFGWVSRSVREAQMLEALQRDGLPGPRCLAAGEDGQGEAFVLIEEVPQSVGLMAALEERPDTRARRELAVRLGARLARLHEAGFCHGDLYAKHVLVREKNQEPCLLDWQRARYGRITRADRIRDLACLHATLPNELAGPSERLACLRAYLGEPHDRRALRRLAAEVEALARRLRRHRHIREKCRPPTATQQAWISLDGQALSITPALAKMTAGQSLDWLALDRQVLPMGTGQTYRWLILPGGPRVLLVRRRQWISWWQRCLSRLARRPILASQQRQATLLWRLERHGVTAPRVLAVGERKQGRAYDSFLLSQPLDGVVRLEMWLLANGSSPERVRVFFQAGQMLARMHEGCCYFAEDCFRAIVVLLDGEGRPRGVGLEDGAAVTPRRVPCPALARRDVMAFRTYFTVRAGDPAGWWTHFEQGYAIARNNKQALTPNSSSLNPDPSPKKGRGEKEIPSSLWRRLTTGCRMLHVRPDWEEFAGPGWANRIMQAGVTDDFHAKQGRSTGRWVLEAGARRLAVYLKRHYRLPFWTGWLAALWPKGGWSPAMQEYRHLEWARHQGLHVPATVAVGEFVGPWGKHSSFLIVEELTDMLPLHQAIPLAASRLRADVFRRWKRGLAVEMARLARLLHDRRHFHKDLYLCHFFIHTLDTQRLPENWRERVALIDLHRLAHHPWTWPLWQLKDLAQLLYSSEIEGVDVRDRAIFWKHYRGPQARRGLSRWLRWLVVLKWRRYRAHNLRRKQREMMKETARALP